MDVIVNRVDAAGVTGQASDAGTEFRVAQFDGGTGTVDSVTGAGTITWDTGTWTLNAYQGSFGAPDEVLSSPRLEIDSDGSGELSFEAYIPAGLDMNGQPSPAVGPARVTLVEFDDVDELTSQGMRLSDDFTGRAYEPAEGELGWLPCEEGGVVTGGSWPSDWVRFVPASVRPHYYTTGCGGRNVEKPALPIQIRWDDEAPTITHQPTLSSTSFALGAPLHTAGASVAVTGSPTPTIQWQRSLDGVTWSDVPGATGTLHAAPLVAADNGARIRAVVDNGVGEPVISDVIGPITVAVTATSLGTWSPPTSYLAPGANASISINVNGSPVPEFQVERSDDAGATWTPIQGATSTPRTGGIRVTQVVSNVQLSDHGARFRLRASNGVGPEVVSGVATLDVQLIAPTFIVQPTGRPVFAGGHVQFGGAVSARPAATIQWQYSADDGATWQDWTATPGTSGPLTISGGALTTALDGYLFRSRATNIVGVGYSQPARLTVLATTGEKRIVILPVGEVVPGGPVTFDVLAEGVLPPVSVTSNASWLVTDAASWQPGQPINPTGALLNEVAALPNLLRDGGGLMYRRVSFPASSFVEGRTYGIGLVGTDAAERYYDMWAPFPM